MAHRLAVASGRNEFDRRLGNFRVQIQRDDEGEPVAMITANILAPRHLSEHQRSNGEAFEEAGVSGRVGAKSVGFFAYDKILDENGVRVSCEVRVFPLLVKRQSETWPEIEQRVVEWVAPDKALTLIEEPELKALVAAFAKRLAVAPSRSAARPP